MLRGEAGFPRSLALTLRRALDDPNRRFWLIVGLVTLGGAFMRVQIHDFDLPWLDKADELRLWLYVRDLRGMPESTAPTFRFLQYPPLIIWLHHLVQPLAESQGRPFAVDAILDLRRLVLVFNALGGVWFAMLGRRCGGAPAGIIAAALWAFEDDLIFPTALAISESVVFPLLVLSVLLAVHALESARRWWLAPVSMVTGLLCFLGDYRFLVAVIPGFAALVWRAWLHYRPGWQRALLWGSAGLALIAVSVILILARLPENFQGFAQETLSTYLWDFETFFLFLGKSVELVHPLVFFLIILLALPALRSRPVPCTGTMSTPAVLMAGATLFLTTWATSSIRPYRQDSVDFIWGRYLLPALLMTWVLLATVASQLLSSLQNRWLRNLLSTVLLIFVLLFQFPSAWRLIQWANPLPWPVIVRRWADDNLESSTILVYPAMNRWFNPVWGGIPPRVWFDWWRTDDIRNHSLDELIETHKITWALIPLPDHRRLTESNPGKALLDQMLLIREFTAPPVRRHDETLLYRLWRMQHETDVRFGEHIRLTGYDLHSTDPLPGEQLDLTLYWNATSTPPENYSFFLHLVADDDPRPLAQVDGNPAVPVRLTQTWDRPEETLISPRFSLSLPADLAPGDYRILLGLYDFESGARLPVRDAQGNPLGDARELLQLRIPAS